MAKLNKLLLVVSSVLHVLLCYDAEAHVIYVCGPHEQCLDKHNHLLFQVLIQKQEFSPGMDMKFSNGTYTVPGNDSVNYKMEVRDTRDIRLLGDPFGATIIQCDGRLRFNFTNITNLTITDIQFVSCGAPWDSISREAYQAEVPKGNPAALLLVNVYTLVMSNAVITFSQGYGMLCINLMGESSIMNTNFTSNNKYYRDGVGGSILLFFQDNSFVINPIAGSVMIVINNSNFLYSHLEYEKASACPKMPSASGLGIVIKQSLYPIHVVVNHTQIIDNDTPALAVYSHNTPASYSILVQHSYLRNVYRGAVDNVLLKTATIMFISLIDKLPSVSKRPNKTMPVARMINMHNNVFTGHVDGWYSLHSIGYVDVTLFLNITVSIKSCVFLAYNIIVTTAINIRSVLQDQGVYSNPEHNKLVKIMECNFTGLQGNAITARTITSADPTINSNMLCYRQRHILISYTGLNPDDQLSLLIENTTFIYNSNSAIKAFQISNITVTNSQFIENNDTAIMCKASNIYISGTVVFIGNKGFDGGAISLTTTINQNVHKSKKTRLEQISLLYLHCHARLLLINNRATNKGGAIYVDTGEVTDRKNRYELCFYQLVDRVLKLHYLYQLLPKIILINNTAGFAGDSIYGGFDKECYLETLLRFELKVEDFFIISNQLSTSEIATDPRQLCFCQGSIPNCLSSIDLSVYQGQTILLNAIAIGKSNYYREHGASPALVIARINPAYETKLGRGQYGQNLENRCSQLTFSIYSSKTSVKIIIQLSLIKSEFAGQLGVTILGCPFGFQLEDSPYPGCVCETVVQESGCTCSIDDLIISCPFGKWIGNISSQAIVHHHCPFDYCTSDRDIQVQAINDQCAFNHSGILCGECQSGLSLGFGSSKCKECINMYILLIFPFALAGLGLVLVLFACNLTVSRGTVNGLIYFANVVQVNSSIFVTQNTPQFFVVFVAWVNLDLGIQTCFFNGMDMHAKAWLQFAFPVYIWLIVAIIILFSRRSMTVSRLTRDNTVPVLATLFLLSYAKLLRAIIAVFSFTYLRYPDGTYILVWMYDGNIPFAEEKHAALFVVALVAMLGFIIPYTLLLLLSPYLQRWSHHKPLRWVNKLKPFLDSNHGPYKNKMRNWTGIILLIRAIQFTCFAVNAEGDPNINLLIILLPGMVPFLLVWVFGSAYKHLLVSVLEFIFIVLLCLLASVSLYIRTTALDVDSKQTVITTLALSIAFGLFLAILIYHSCRRIKFLISSRKPNQRYFLSSKPDHKISTEQQINCQNDVKPTISYVTLSDLNLPTND